MSGSGYHFTAKAISRGGGQSAVHTAAYNARDQLEDEREGRMTKDYSRRGDVLFSGIFAPSDAPAWATDREQLWNRAEAAEKRVDAQTARNVEFAIPHQLNQAQRERLLTDFARESFARKGMVADVNMHPADERGDARNVHAHCLVTMRRIEGDGFAKTKAREWNSKAQLGEWREKWAHMGARALERAGFHDEAERWKHGHETIDKQHAAALARGDVEFAGQLNREPTEHKGPVATAQERRGEQPAREIEQTADRREAATLTGEIAAIEAALTDERAKAAKEQPRAPKERPGELDGRQMGIDTRAEAKRGREEAAQAKWKAEPHEARSAKGREDTGGIKVSRGVGKVAEGLVSFVGGVLESLLGGGTAPRPPSNVERLTAQRKALAALEKIRESIENGRDLKPEDVRNLTPDHLQNIRRHGDAYLEGIIRRMELDRERERDDYGRARER